MRGFAVIKDPSRPRAGQNTPYKVFEILNTKYSLKSISNTKIPNTFS